MAKVFLTGSTGFLGIHLAKALLRENNEVVALCRSKSKGGELQAAGVLIAEGDIANRNSLEAGMKGCDQVYHMAALAKPWDKDKDAFRKVNIEGTRNVLEAALTLGVKKVVITSTAGVLGYSINGEIIDEQPRKGFDLSTDYERTKLEAEELARTYAEKGIEVVIVNPTRVYGPGVLSQSNSTTKMIRQFSRGKWRIVPGDGEGVGNYVYVDDVIQGHLLAMQKGKNGERYILGGENASFNQFFAVLRKTTGQQQKLFNMPLGIMLGVSGTMQFLADNFGIKPLITPPFIRKYSQKAFLTSEKAVRELGYQPVMLEEGVLKTLAWLKNG